MGLTSGSPQGETHGCAESQFRRTAGLDEHQLAPEAKAMEGLSHITE